MAKKGDLLVTIKGDATQFDKTISESTNQVRKFNSSANQAGSSVGGFTAGMGRLAGSFGKLAGPLGIAITAISTLNKAMNATETSTDFFANNIAAAGDSVTQFFVALQTGDFSNFDKGLTDIWRRAKDAVEALDQLGNTAKSLQFIKAFGDLGISDLMEDIFDSDNMKDQLNMLEKAKGIAEEIKEAAEEQQKDTKTVIDTKFASYGLPADLITKERLKATFSLDAKVNKDQVKKEAEEGVKAYNKELKQLKKDSEFIYDNVTKYGRNKSKGFNQTTYNEGKKALQEKYADALVTDIALNKMNNDEVLFPMVDAYIKSAQDLNAAQKGVNQLQKTEKKINQGTYGNAGLKNTSSSNLPTIFADGSMAKAEQEVQKYTKEVNEAIIGTNKWKEAQENLNKAIDNKNLLEVGAIQSIQVEDLTYKQVQDAHKRILDLIGNTTNKELREQFEKIAKSYENRIKEMDLKMQAEFKAQWSVATPSSDKYNLTGKDSPTDNILKLLDYIKNENDPVERSRIYREIEREQKKLESMSMSHKRKNILPSGQRIYEDGRRTPVYNNPDIDTTNKSEIDAYVESLKKFKEELDLTVYIEGFDVRELKNQIEDEIKVMTTRSNHLAANDRNFPWAQSNNYNVVADWLTKERVAVKEFGDELDELWVEYNKGLEGSVKRAEELRKKWGHLFENEKGSEYWNEHDILLWRGDYIKGLLGFYSEVDQIQELNKKKLDFRQKLEDDLSKIKNQGWNAMFGSINSIDSVLNSIKSLDDTDLNGWEKFVILMNALNTSVRATVDTIETIKNISSATKALSQFNEVLGVKDEIDTTAEIASISAVSGAKIAADTAETTSAVASNAAVTASMYPLVTAARALMATQSTAAYAGIPFVGVGLATAQIASMNALITANSVIPAFAEGGLVYGNTIAQVGEYANASSNPEVIAPLSKLKNILAESGGTGGNVRFEIEGKKLVGVLDNYSSIKRKR